jgi:3-dehydroquinate synthase
MRVLPDRDTAKSIEVLAEVYGWLAEVGIGRHDTVVGVGGGAVTDLAGFAAATWLRGVESVLVPTTLLGAVDASIGGKTGINIGGKNLVGAFWHPALVLVDLDVLDRLPDVVRREGMAETLKAGLIADPNLVAVFEQHGEAAPLDLIVPAAIRVKAEVVLADPRESGRRAILNYGHTIGHGIEVAAGMSHGHAVAVGMVAAARASTLRLGFGEENRHNDLIASLGLPTSAPPVDATLVRRLLQLDKKRDAAGLRMILLRDIGHPEMTHVEPELVDEALAAVGVE